MSRRALLGAIAAAWAGPAFAQARRQPDGPVTLIVPVTPSTAQDVLARMLAPSLGEALGQPVIVENRAGASGTIGTGAVARAAPDGRTLMMQGAPLYMSPSLVRSLPYDAARAFLPLVKVAEGSSLLAVRPDLPAEDVAGFVALARARPGDLDYASPGNGTAPHMAMALFALAAGIELNHIPYRGTAPAVQDLLGRRVAAMILPVAIAMPLARDGLVRLLAVTSAERWPELSNVPTMAESGFGAATVTILYGLYGPAGLSPQVAGMVNGAVNTWLERPATRAALLAQGLSPGGGSAEAFAAAYQGELTRWAAVVRDARIKPD